MIFLPATYVGQYTIRSSISVKKTYRVNFPGLLELSLKRICWCCYICLNEILNVFENACYISKEDSTSMHKRTKISAVWSALLNRIAKEGACAFMTSWTAIQTSVTAILCTLYCSSDLQVLKSIRVLQLPSIFISRLLSESESWTIMKSGQTEII